MPMGGGRKKQKLQPGKGKKKKTTTEKATPINGRVEAEPYHTPNKPPKAATPAEDHIRVYDPPRG